MNPLSRRQSTHPCLILAGLLLVGLTPAAGAQPIAIPGLESDALVVYDADGVPHICAASELDAIRILGYEHARHRFFQMDSLRRTFSGTLAELVGSPALASDVELRTLGLRRAAEESLAAYEAAGLTAAVAWLEAYAAGVNHYLRTQPLPPEYGALELSRAVPWTPLDSAVLIKGLAFSLSFDLLELDLTVQAGAYAVAGAAGGFDGLALLFEDVERSAPFEPTVSIPAARRARSPAAKRPWRAPDPRTVNLARRTLERISDLPVLQSARRGREAGSNWWLVSGEHTESGFAMLANDPHLDLDTPAIFFEAHLITSATPGCGIAKSRSASVVRYAGGKHDHPPAEEPLNAIGVTFAGTPVLVHGCNPKICWGSTNNPMDVTDVYQEILVVDPLTLLPTHTLWEGQPEPLVMIPQTYRVNQLGDGKLDNLADSGIGPLDGGLTFVVPRRNNGPIIAVDLSGLPVIAFSVQYTGWRATLELETFRRWLRTEELERFVAALQYFDFGSQNWAYADVDGTIAYFTSAELPIREDLQNFGFPDGGVPPFLIRDGTHVLQHEWLAVQNPQPQQALGYEILPFAEMPQVIDPAAGYVLNANNDPVGNTLDNDVLNEVRPGGGVFYLSPGYSDLRAGRIARLLEGALAAGGKVDVGDLKAMQANNQLLDAELIAPFLTAAFANASAPGAPAELRALAADPGVAEAVARLAAWDYSTPTGLAAGYDPGDDPANLPEPSAAEIANSVAATIFSVWRGQIVRGVVDATLTQLGLGSFLPSDSGAYRALAHLLTTFDLSQGVGASGVDFFALHRSPALTPAERQDVILLTHLRMALDLLAGDEFAVAFHHSTDQDDYRWGHLHRLELDHLLGDPFSVPAAGGFDHLGPAQRGVARSGGYVVVDASSHSARADGVDDFTFDAGPARRFVGVLDPAGLRADQILPGGQSGVLGSPHYASQLGRWLTNGYHPLLLDPADVQVAGVFQQPFEPACPQSATALCFGDGRFKVEATWSMPVLGERPGQVVPGASDASGAFYFFAPENWEMLVKVLNGCALNDHYWAFIAAATSVGWEVTIEDTLSGQVWTEASGFGRLAGPVADTVAFATCP